MQICFENIKHINEEFYKTQSSLLLWRRTNLLKSLLNKCAVISKLLFNAVRPFSAICFCFF